MTPHEAPEHGGRRRLARAARGPAVESPVRDEPAKPVGDALASVAAAAAAASRLEDVLELAGAAALEAVGAQALAIGRWTRGRGRVETLVNVGRLGSGQDLRSTGEAYDLSDYPSLRRLLHEGISYFWAIDDPDVEPAGRRLLAERGAESAVGVPVVVDGEVWGELWASTALGTRRFKAADIRVLEAIASQLGGVIARAELFSRVSRMAYEDPLTGLPNRRALDERLERAAARARSAVADLTVVLCDVDGLKRLNDEGGHEAGDRALARVAEALVAACAPLRGAFVARMAGDEFAVVLEGHGVAEAGELASACLRAVGAERDPALSVSFGAAAAGPGAAGPAALLRAADTALYAAKRRGGGQLCTAAPALQSSPARERLNGRPPDLEQTAALALERLDGELEDAGELDRLEAVAVAFAQSLNASAWVISVCEGEQTVLRSVSSAEDRGGRLAGVRVGLDESFDLRDFPASAAVIRRPGWFYASVDDLASDAAERRLLARLGHTCVLGIGATGEAGTYLLELYGDEDTAPLRPAALSAGLVARAAAAAPAAARRRTEAIEKRGRQLALTESLGPALAEATSPDEVARIAVDALRQAFGHPACSVVRVRNDGLLELAAAAGPAAELLHDRGWTAPAGLGLIGRALRERRLVIVGDVAAEPDYRPTIADSRSELTAPLWCGDELWGAIDIQRREPAAFDADDGRFMATVAAQVSAALRSVTLYERLERAYLGTAQALSAALEAKDSYTAEHSRSLAANAEAVGRRLGMGPGELRTLRYATAFHDIGKLAIHDSILKKEGPLTIAELEEVQRHTVIGEQILAPIDFLADVRPIVRHGHERWDGMGYPDGLAGEDIPLASRVIFACDAFDAMTSDRPYRKALPTRVARAELAANAGGQFDPRVVSALLAVLDEQG